MGVQGENEIVRQCDRAERERVRGSERKRGEERESLFQSVLQVDSRRVFFPGSMREVYCCSPSLR